MLKMLEFVGMRVLPQVISASLCERNWSAYGHIHTKIRSKVSPETTEKIAYIYSNSERLTLPGQLDTLSSLEITESPNRRIVESRIC